MLDTIKSVGVIGSGLMGSGIAQIAAQAGYIVIFCDVSLETVQKGLDGVQHRLESAVKKGSVTAEEANAIVARITPHDSYAALADVDVVFEAIFENMQVKKELYQKLDAICKESCIFASNTSGLSVTEMASATGRPNQFVGAHFFNPVPVMKLLELVKGYETAPQTIEVIRALGQDMGKEVIVVTDSPLFCVNRILVPMLNEAIFVLYEGIATREEIDRGMVLGANHPIGPLALADLVGLDTLLSVTETLYRETRDSKYRPCPLLVSMVRAGHYGRKNGKGFYLY